MIPSSRNFSESEVVAASAPATAADIERASYGIRGTLAVLESVRRELGNVPVTIGSLLRTPEENTEVGGSPTSGHLDGTAADIRVRGMTPEQVMHKLAPHVNALRIDQLILYNTHVHVGTGPRLRGDLLDARFGTPLRPWRGGVPVQLAPVDVTATAPAAPRSAGELAGQLVFAAISAVILWLFLSITGK